MIKLRYAICVATLLTTGLLLSRPFTMIHAQDAPIIRGILPYNVSWSDDSSRLFFQDGGLYDRGVQTDGLNWYEYSVVTEELTQSNTWPLQPNLTTEQLEHYHIAHNEPNGGGMSFVFPSPNNRYLVYAATKPTDWGEAPTWPLGIADLHSGEYRIFEEIIVQELSDYERTYRVRWSANSSSFTVFTITTFGGEQRVIYFTDLDEGLENLTVLSLLYDDITFFTPERGNIFPDDAFDLSSDGKEVLISAPGETGTRLILWNTNDPTQSKILIEGRILDAAFVGDSDGFVVTITQSGVLLYDLSSDTITTLDSNIVADSLNSAWISPNSQYIAYYDESSKTAETGLYVVSINGIPMLD